MKAYWLRYRGTQFPVRRGEYLIGRSPYCSIVVANPLASRRHCALRLAPEGLILVDLGSANGTHVNGSPVTSEVALNAGDKVRIGSEVLTIEQAEEGAGDARRTRHETVQTPLPADGVTAPPPVQGPEAESFEDESSTITHASTLELLEALVASAADNDRPQDLAPIIQRTVERIVRQSGLEINADTLDRLHRIVDGVMGWFPQGSLDEWKSEVLRNLQKPRA